MSFHRELAATLFFYGFRECKSRSDLNFLKLTKEDYLIMRVFEKVEIADLIHAKFYPESSPCAYEPYLEKIIKSGFSPETDNQVISDYIDSLDD